MTKKNDAEIIREIEALQAIQKRNHPDTQLSRAASEKLQPLFAEMARRQKERGVNSI